MLSNKVYDVLKFVAQYVLPGCATLYFGLARIWGLPYSEQVVGTILAFDAFLGALLGLSVIKYNEKMAHIEKYVQPVMPEVMDSTQSKSALSMSNSTYDILYWIAQIVLPAIGTLYFALASLWGLPYAQQIIGTISLVDAFLGIFLGISTAQYKKIMPEQAT